MQGMKWLLSWVIALSMAALVGCAATGTGTTVDPVMSAADLGDVGCTGLLVQLKPAQLADAKAALGKMNAVLASDNPTLAALSQIMTATNLDPRYVAIGRSILRRVAAHIGGSTDVIPKDSVGFQAAQAFADACGVAFGS